MVNQGGNKLKIVFMGTPDFAKESLEAIYNEGYDIEAVVTNPDKPKGRGMKMIASPVKEFAIEKNLKIYQPVKVRNNTEFIDELKKINPDVICVVAYGKILPKEILEIAKYGCINVHGSLLPQYRGAAPIQWAVLNGDKTTGITTMYMDEGMDTGDMLLKAKIDITDEDNLETVYNKLKVVGGELLVKTLNGIVNNSITRVKQEGEATYAPMINKDTLKIDFNKTGREIFNHVRGLSPVPGTLMFIDENTKFNVYKVSYELKEIEGIENGGVVEISKSKLSIKCADGVVNILEIQPPNSKRMDVKAFLAGNKIINSDSKFVNI